jgi:exo-beta-1,3-glucanase (GH17 family)
LSNFFFFFGNLVVAVTTKTTHVTVTSTVPVVVSTATVYPVSSHEHKPVPTPVVTICPTPGTYTFPAATVTLTETTTVCAASSAVVTPGVHTLGGVTTIVETSTTVVCPYATVQTVEGTITSTILTTTYVCPAAGTYTIGAYTVTANATSTCVYPVPTSYVPGTYVQPEKTVTVTLTSQVVFCPYTVPTEAPAPSYSTSPASSSPASSSAAPSSSAVSTPKVGSSGAWSITYSPYTSSGGCKSASDIESDIADISSKGFSSVRIYSTDCSGLQNVGSSCQKHGLKMIIGVFIDASGISAASQQVTDIVNWGQWSLVELIVIGNEAVFNGYCSAQQLHDFIVSCKSTFASAGYSGPCTTTETLNILQQYGSTLCDAIDVIGCNVYAFFNSGISSSGAGDFVKGQYDLVKGICPGKEAYILETGWPSAGSCNGAACPGPSQQKEAITGTIAAIGDHAVIFSYS